MLYLLAALTASPAAAQDMADTASLAPGPVVSLVTVSPGSSVSARFGHAALVLDEPASDSTARAWSFGQSGLDGWAAVATLVRGGLPDGARVVDADSMISAQLEAGRDVRIQTLALDAASVAGLREALRAERGLGDPYRFFDANCTTRIRDLLDLALEGRLSAATVGVSSPWTRRERVAAYTAPDPLLHVTIHSLLGTGVDAPADRWQQLFLPETLADALDEAGVVVEDRTLRGSDRVWAPPSPRPVAGVGWLVAGLFLGGLVAFTASKVGTALGAVWSVFAGLAGVGVLALQATAVHPLMAGNLNGWLLNPLWLGVAVMAWGRRPNAPRSYELAVVITGGSTVLVLGALFGVVGGVSSALAAIVVPAHLGLAFRLGRRSRRGAHHIDGPEAPR